MSAIVTNEIQDSVSSLYIAFFGRAPDARGFGYWTEEMARGVSPYAIAADFARSDEWISNYGGLTPTQQVTLFYNNVFNRDPDQDGLDYWVGEITDGTPVSEVAYQIIWAAYLGGEGVDPDDNAIVLNKIAVAEYFAIDLKSNDTDIAATAFDGVTQDEATVQAAEDRLYAEVNPTPTYTLTTNIDNFTATALNVEFTGVAAGDATSTLNTGDILKGIGGTNTFSITGNGDASTKLVQTTNVQDVYVRSVANTQVSQQLMSGVNNFASKGSNANLTVNSANLATEFWVIDSVSGQTTNLDIQYAAATGSSDKANLSVQNAGSKVGSTTYTSTITTGSNNIESVALDTAGTNYVTLAAGTAAKAITITGSGANTVAVSSAATTFSLDASATSGANTLDVGTVLGSTTSVTGGTGADVLAVNMNKALAYQPTISAVETLEANFSVTGATFNASKTTDLTKAVITATASGGTAGFSGLSEEVVAVNVGKSSAITSGVVTVGYASGSESDVTVRIGATSSTSDPVVDIDGLTVTGNKGSLTIHSVGDATNLITAALSDAAVLQANTATELTIAGVDQAITISNTDAGADAVISATGANVITIDASKKSVTLEDTAAGDNFIDVDESLTEFNVTSDAGIATVADLDFDSAAGDSNLTVNFTSGTKALTMGSVAVDGFAEKTVTYVSNITGGKGTLTAGAVDISGGATATNVATNVTYTANIVGGTGQINLDETVVDAIDVGTLTANVTITGGEGNIDIKDGGVAFDFESEIKALSATVNVTTGAGGIDTGDFVFNSGETAGGITGAAATASFTATTAEEGALTVDELKLSADFTGSTLTVDLNAASGDVTVDKIDVVGATGLGTVSLTLAAAADQTLTITSLAESGVGDSQKIGSIVVSGAGDVTVGGGTFINSQNTVVDATAATGSVNIDLGASTGNLSVYLGNAGSSAQNTIVTGGGTDYIVGGTGKDSMTGGSGADTLLGGSGNDTISGGTGADVIDVGAGTDTIYYAAAGQSGVVTVGTAQTVTTLDVISNMRDGDIWKLLGTAVKSGTGAYTAIDADTSATTGAFQAAVGTTTTLTDNGANAIRGTYNTTSGAWAVDAAGSDLLFVWDQDGNQGTTEYVAVVLLGSGAETLSAATFSSSSVFITI